MNSNSETKFKKKYLCAYVKTGEDFQKCIENDNTQALLTRYNKIEKLIEQIKGADEQIMKANLKDLQMKIEDMIRAFNK